MITEIETEALEIQIWREENIRVVFRQPKDQMIKGRFSYATSWSRDEATVKAWLFDLTRRFDIKLENVMIILGNGEEPSPLTLLRSVRESYSKNEH
jgi:hypothetical protein